MVGRSATSSFRATFRSGGNRRAGPFLSVLKGSRPIPARQDKSLCHRGRGWFGRHGLVQRQTQFQRKLQQEGRVPKLISKSGCREVWAVRRNQPRGCCSRVRRRSCLLPERSEAWS